MTFTHVQSQWSGLSALPPPNVWARDYTGQWGMAEKRQKTVSYRRAEWFAQGFELEKSIRSALKALKDINERTVLHGDQIVRCMKTRDPAIGGILLHVTTETPGEDASVVPKAAPNTKELDLATRKPPEDGEWLDGDAFLYVNGDNVCLCTTGVRDGAVRQFFYNLFQRAKLPKNSIRFDLMKVANVKKVKLIHQQGVKELELRATLYKATNDYERRKAQVIGMTGIVGKHMRAFLNKPYDVTPDGLRVSLTLKTDKRFGRKAVTLGEQRIEALAADVIKNVSEDQNDYEYIIRTGTGQKITVDEIFMKSSAEIDRDGKTVKCDKAWKELTKFYENLQEAGALEQ